MLPAAPRAFLAGFVLGLAIPAVTAAPFQSSSLPTGLDTQPRGVAIGDLNGDGRPDLATANFSRENLTWIARLADNAGWDPVAEVAPIIPFSRPSSVAIGDLNGDGRNDVAAANTLNKVTIVLRRADGSGWEEASFTAAVVGTPGQSAVDAVAIGDLNGDGRRDLAFTSFISNSVSTILRRADNSGWEDPVRMLVAAGPIDVEVGDLNGDGRSDLAVAQTGGRLSVILRRSDSAGWESPVEVATGDRIESVAIGDLNGDGRPDLAAADQNQNSVITVLRRADNSGWEEAVSVGPTGSAPTSIVVGDLNGDGRPDLATADLTADTVTLILRRKDNTGWQTPVVAGSTQSGPYALAFGDLNGDSRPDLVTANANASSVTVLLNDATPPVTTDDVPPGWVNGPLSVTLSASDGGFGVERTYYTTGVNPAPPTTASAVYNPVAKPTLRNGERIRYFSVDGAGNAEAVKTSAAAKVVFGDGSFGVTGITSARGVLNLQLSVPTPGRVSVTATTRVSSGSRTRTLTYASTGSSPVSAGTSARTVRPTRNGAALFRERGRLLLSVVVTFIPVEGRSSVVTKTLTVR